MNLKLALQLSLFGLIMAFATISLIPEKVEWIFWVFIFAFVAYVIAKVAPGKYFLHGFMVSVFNSIWLTAIHLAFFTTYVAHHPNVAAMIYNGIHPRITMLCSSLLFGAAFGLIQGLFCLVASKIIEPNVAE